jgi:UDP-N-acetylglucosamine 2-epimerase
LLTVLCVIGTRPEAIKMAPVIAELRRHPERAKAIVCLTGQHRQMVDQALDAFGIRSDVDLDVMRDNQSLAQLTATLFERLDGAVRDCAPDWVLAQGDTTSVLVASLVAFYARVHFGHVEAGLRTGDRDNPFPEEVNRCVADKVADLLFAPTERSRQNLRDEGHPENRIVVTGNTIVDALHSIARRPFEGVPTWPTDRRFVLITAHRRESFGAPLCEICAAIRTLAETFCEDRVQFVYPVHPNPNVRGPVHEQLGGISNVSLIEPLDYPSLVHLLKRSELILTDSGGIQEEAPAFGVPVLVMRETTERPEGIDAGVARLVGTSATQIVAEASRLLRDPEARKAMARIANPYGDGHAAERIVESLLAFSAVRS